MNKAQLSGRLIGPIFQGPGRVTSYYRFRVEAQAEEEGRWPDRVNCVAFGVLADQLMKLHEGDPIAVTGRITVRSRPLKEGTPGAAPGAKEWVTEVVVSEVGQPEVAVPPGMQVSPNAPANPQQHIPTRRPPPRTPVRQPQPPLPPPPSDTDDLVPF